MGGRCAGSIPFVQNLNFRPLSWSRYNPSYLFYKTGLREFLAACGVRGTSCDIVFQDTVSHEVVGEGPRRIIFDLENISEHEKAAGTKSSRIPMAGAWN